MFVDPSPQVGVWAAMSSPFCAIYAVRSADRATAARTRSRALYGIVAFLIALTVSAASARGYGLATLILACSIAYLAVFDLRVLAVPIWPVVALTGLGVAVSGVDDALDRVLAAALAWVAFTALSFAYRHLRGRDGLGEGDALVAAFLAAWLSYEGLAWSVALGGVCGVIYAFACGKRSEAMPFVPALAIGVCFYLVSRSFIS